MNVLTLLEELQYSSRIAAYNLQGQRITYQQLWDASERLAAYLLETRTQDTPNNDSTKSSALPIPVIGHKDPLMLVCFLAAVKSGVAYCPIDAYTPPSRIDAICLAIQPQVIINLTETSLNRSELASELTRERILEIIADDCPCPKVSSASWVHEDQTFYIIFTSGSTGAPKGVQISAQALSNYLKWISTVDEDIQGAGKRYLNQAPLSFDLSVMDVYLSLTHEGTLLLLDKSTQEAYGQLIAALKNEQPSVWVSTPSFVELCLADKSFNETEVPNLNLFLFCGETLTNKTAARLQERFPHARIHNTYGPTESTVCVTDVLVDDKLLATYNPLPIGKARPGTTIYLTDEDGVQVPEGEQGEIIIAGDTVSSGYYKDEIRNERAFFTDARTGLRAYRTGDIGYVQDGLLFYCGRKDAQIKWHGYRIELGDIEKNLLLHPDVEQACIAVRYSPEGKVRTLTACVVYTGSDPNPQASLIAHLEQLVPSYMVVRRFKFCDSLPLTLNGKVDRRAVAQLV